MVKEQSDFLRLMKMKQSNNLLIIEVDGFRQEDLEYYKEKYHVANHFIENNTMLAT